MMIMPNMGGPKSWADAAWVARSTGEAAAIAGFEPMIGAAWGGWLASFPLARQFFTSFQGAEPEGARLWRMVQSLAGLPNLAELVEHDLGGKVWQHYFSAVMTLEFVARWRAAGCDVELVARDRTKGRRPTKTPDARVKVVDRWITVEFKALHDHDDLTPWFEKFEPALGSVLMARGIAGTVFERDLTPAALTDVEAVADGLADIVAKGAREWTELPHGTGKARLAPYGFGTCGYPVVQKPDLDRLRSRLLSGWGEQLARATDPTLLVVSAKTRFPFSEPTLVIERGREFARMLDLPLRDRPYIGAVLVYDVPPLVPPVSAVYADLGSLRIGRDTAPIGFARFSVITCNGGATVPLRKPELERLVGPSQTW